VADVILGGAVDADVVEVFVRKHDMASSFPQAPSVMPFLVGEVFTQEGFALAKQKGIVPVTTTNLFGAEIAKALKALIQLLADTGERAAVNPEYLEQVLNSLTRIEGAANNLRGALFEHVIGALVKDVEGGFLEIGGIWRDRDSGDTAEIDVLLNRDSEPPLVVECKAKTPGAMVSQKEVEHWLTDRVPKLKTMLGQSRHFAGAKPQFEIWSNGPFHPAALQWLGEQPSTVEGYSWGWRDGEALKKVAEKAKSPSIRKTLNEHYFKHPLATLATTRTSKRAKSAKAA
jgi:hypothetical protein